MKKTELESLRENSVEELAEIVAASRRELMQLRFSQVTEGQRLESKARGLRRHIARCLTLITQKQRQAAATEVSA